MKILHVIPSLERGGAERICLDICGELIKVGHQVIVVILNNVNRYSELSNHIEVKYIKTNYKAHLLRKDEIQIDELQKFINTWKPEVVHSHLYAADLIVLHLKSTAKFISHIHSKRKELAILSKQLPLKQKIIYHIERKKYQNLLKQKDTHSIAISQDCKNYALQRLGQTQDRVHLLHNCINWNKFQAPTKTLTTPIKLVSVGTFNDNKSQDFLIKVVKALTENEVRVNLQLVGDGPSLQNCKNLAFELGLDEIISFEGQIPNPEQILATAHVFVHAAKSEAFGLAILEAMAASLPVVSTDGKGNRDIIQDGENGYMVWERDIERFAEAIKNLTSDEKKYDTIAEKASLFALHFDTQDYCKKLLEIYKKQT